MTLFPFLSEYDPLADKEGPLDPLGFYGIAHALGVKLILGSASGRRILGF